jgi:GxxExxY protein
MMKINKLTSQIIGAAIDVHRYLGPGLLESTYETCLAYELEERGFKVTQQKPFPVVYKEIQLDHGYRLDLLINDAVIVEIKAVESILPVHKAQLLSYLKFSGCKIGLLLNFNVTILKNGGIHRLIKS